MRAKILLAALFLIAAAIVPIICGAQDGPIVMSVTGDPKIMKKGADSWESCSANMALDAGDRVKTSAGEDIKIAFAAKANLINIKENSDVVLLITPDGGSIDLLSGEALALIKKLPSGSTFEIKTPSGVSGARGTEWAASRNSVRVGDGTVYFHGDIRDKAGNVTKEAFDLRAGEKMTVNEGRFERSMMSGEESAKLRDAVDSLRQVAAVTVEATGGSSKGPSAETTATVAPASEEAKSQKQEGEKDKDKEKDKEKDGDKDKEKGKDIEAKKDSEREGEGLAEGGRDKGAREGEGRVEGDSEGDKERGTERALSRDNRDVGKEGGVERMQERDIDRSNNREPISSRNTDKIVDRHDRIERREALQTAAHCDEGYHHDITTGECVKDNQ